ncbi:MAG: hypothetical protein PF480_08995 [Roseovarius sp.]|jgi:hypothetical protein|nr:hypothetical protein [Roseovarius sp.]
MREKMYMNIETGSVAPADEWGYQDENGETVNAVDRGEVIEVVLDNGEWIESSA